MKPNETTYLLDNSSLVVNETKLLSPVNCPNFTEQDEHILEHFTYWVGGVSVCIVSFTGIILNLTAICVLLTRLSNRNNFNQLIVILFTVDSVYLILSVITTFQRKLGLTNRILTIIFPKFTYPISSTSLTLSIFMTVGITHERYIAVKYPIIHSARMRSAKYRRINLLKYVLCIMFGAVAFNVPKFFEATLDWYNPAVINKNNTKDR